MSPHPIPSPSGSWGYKYHLTPAGCCHSSLTPFPSATTSQPNNSEAAAVSGLPPPPSVFHDPSRDQEKRRGSTESRETERIMDDKSKKGRRRSTPGSPGCPAAGHKGRGSRAPPGRSVPGRLASLVKEQRARLYIVRRCVTMLLCWRD
jgi:hypothetical protein